MYNTSSFLTLLCLERSWEPISIFQCHGNVTSPCWKEMESMLSFHASTSLTFLLLFVFFSSSILLSKLLWSLFQMLPTSKRTVEGDDSQDETDVSSVTTDECTEKEDLVADVVGGKALLFLHRKSNEEDNLVVEQGKDANMQDSLEGVDTDVEESAYGSPMEGLPSEKPEMGYIVIPLSTDVSTPVGFPTPDSSADKDIVNTIKDKCVEVEDSEGKNFVEDESFLIINHSQLGNKNSGSQVVHKGEDNFADSSTCGSTSKSSHEWRSSTNFRDSETECLFSSSSRRSSSNWESYTVFRKYDEEMMFFDRISAQKLNETEYLRSVKVHPRSISQRIVHKLRTKDKQFQKRGVDPYQELEVAYVAQICLTWEALNWNYKNFQTVNAKQQEVDSGCPAHIAQQFQQFQVLLQRFIENEPYEHGRRPEIYARMRILAPKLLQVPEFRDSEADENKELDMCSRISSARFLMIMEVAIRTFMNFLKADKGRHWQVLIALVKKKPTSVDPTLFHLIKNANEKKKSRIKDLRRSRKCLRKRKLKEEEEMEILMALIDMKVVSRVLRMPEISEQQLHWCEEKMRKVRVWQGKIQRDSSPLFFPVH